MRTKIVENVINEVIEGVEQNESFKRCFRQYLINKFTGNSSEDDLKLILESIEIPEDD